MPDRATAPKAPTLRRENATIGQHDPEEQKTTGPDVTEPKDKTQSHENASICTDRESLTEGHNNEVQRQSQS